MTIGNTNVNCAALLFAMAIVAGCGAAPKVTLSGDTAEQKAEQFAQKTESKESDMPDTIDDKCVNDAIAALLSEHQDTQKLRIETGVRQVADKWQEEDGCCHGFTAFVTANFISDERQLTNLFKRFQDNVEQISGHLHEIGRFLRTPITLDLDPAIPVDHLFANYNLGAHFTEDFYRTKIAFVILLNYKVFTLEEKLAAADSWTREQWARARMADFFSSRVPSSVSQQVQAAFQSADTYISEYNIHMHHLVDAKGERLFPESLSLITHWGLRDELKSHYKNGEGLPRQRMILKVMERIIDQSIPSAVINNPYVDWNVKTNKVAATNVFDFDKTIFKNDAEISNDQEPNTRYKHLLNIFHAVTKADPYYKDTPTYIDRRFERGREIPEQEVVALLDTVMKDPVLKDVAKIMKKRLGRDLEAFDVWYREFGAGTNRSEAELDAIIKKKYPNVAAFQKDLPRILKFVGYSSADAKFLSTKIVVDPSRGAGHASGAARREDAAHLRTRVGKDGMNYKGYNIAVHELGHNVEQVLTLNEMDHYMLNGVPNTAFTESFAFAFQAKDLEILGLKKNKDKKVAHMNALKDIWSTFEISGVAMVDIRIWNWMYDHPEAKADELKDAVIQISKDVWNEYFAPVFGIKDQTILSVYSHIIDIGLYTPDYAIGMLIQNQVGSHFAQKGLAKEMKRMCKIGSITPGAWMKEAVGASISAEPLLEEARKAVKELSD